MRFLLRWQLNYCNNYTTHSPCFPLLSLSLSVALSLYPLLENILLGIHSNWPGRNFQTELDLSAGKFWSGSRPSYMHSWAPYFWSGSRPSNMHSCAPASSGSRPSNMHSCASASSGLVGDRHICTARH